MGKCSQELRGALLGQPGDSSVKPRSSRKTTARRGALARSAARLPALNVAQQGNPMSQALGQPRADMVQQLGWIDGAPMRDDGTQPVGEIAGDRNGLPEAGKVQVRMRVDEPRQDGDVAEIHIRRPSPGRLDGNDLVAGHADDATLQRRPIDRKDPARGQTIRFRMVHTRGKYRPPAQASSKPSRVALSESICYAAAVSLRSMRGGHANARSDNLAGAGRSWWLGRAGPAPRIRRRCRQPRPTLATASTPSRWSTSSKPPSRSMPSSRRYGCSTRRTVDREPWCR